MKKILDLMIRTFGSLLVIHVANMMLLANDITCYIGINGYTLAVSAFFGLPGIAGLYALAYFG